MASIHLSFKDNNEERELYAWICRRSNKSGFIKDVLMKEKKKEETQDDNKVMKIKFVE